MNIKCPVCRGLSIQNATTFCGSCDNTGYMVALSPIYYMKLNWCFRYSKEAIKISVQDAISANAERKVR